MFVLTNIVYDLCFCFITFRLRWKRFCILTKKKYYGFVDMAVQMLSEHIGWHFGTQRRCRVVGQQINNDNGTKFPQPFQFVFVVISWLLSVPIFSVNFRALLKNSSHTLQRILQRCKNGILSLAYTAFHLGTYQSHGGIHISQSFTEHKSTIMMWIVTIAFGIVLVWLQVNCHMLLVFG